jgi:hypothetical protein
MRGDEADEAAQRLKMPSIIEGEKAFEQNAGGGASHITTTRPPDANPQYADNAAADEAADAALNNVLRPKISTKEQLLPSEVQFFDVLRMRSMEVDMAFQRSEVKDS